MTFYAVTQYVDSTTMFILGIVGLVIVLGLVGAGTLLFGSNQRRD